jgi:uncharacterized protein YceK
MSSDLRRFALCAVVTFLATLSCGTIQAVSHDSQDEWFPGVHHDLDSLGHTAGDENPSDRVSASCTAACLGIPMVIDGALRIVDLPFSFVADLVVMPFRTPVESDGEKQDFENPPAGEQEPAPERSAAEVAPGEEVVATVFGRSIQRSELDSATLGELICPPLFEKYRKDHGIVATESEIAEYVAANVRGVRRHGDLPAGQPARTGACRLFEAVVEEGVTRRNARAAGRKIA